jgi:hypothetical protein
MLSYRSLLADTTLTDSSTILKSFVGLAAGSQLEWLVQIEDSLAVGAYKAVSTLLRKSLSPKVIKGPNAVLVNDNKSADSIVLNYISFYRIYHAWKTGTFKFADSLELQTLSHKCPLKDGPVIYQARNLLGIITRKHPVYVDVCSDKHEGRSDEGGKQRKLAGHARLQSYSLIPNPNDGRIQLLQATRDEAPVKIRVYNMLGAAVYSSLDQFTGNKAKLELPDIVPGIYSIVLEDSEGAVYTLRFIKK